MEKEHLFDLVKSIFINGKEEFFEDGVESNFSRLLVDFINTHNVAATEVIQQLIFSDSVNPVVSSEALRWVGYIKTPATDQPRQMLLEACLSHESGYVRDGAVCGLSSMDNPLSLPVVERAITLEQITELRKDMEQLRAQLVETSNETRL